MTPEEIKVADEQTLRTRLAELKAMKRTKSVSRDTDEVNAERFDAMARAYGKYDVEKSMELQQKAQELRDKVQMAKDRKMGLENPEEARRQLRIQLDKAYEVATDKTKYSDAQRNIADKIVKILTKEMARENPSTREASIAIDKLYSGEIPVTQTPPEGGVKDVKYFTDLIDGYVKSVGTKSEFSNKKSALLSELKDSGLSDEDKSRVTKYFDEQESLKKNPAPDRIATTKPEALADIKVALQNLALGSNASRLKPSSNSDAQILWKVQQRGYTPEAVNEGDLALGRSWMEKMVSKITGSTVPIPEAEAKQAQDFIKSQIYAPAFNLLNRLVADKKNVSEYSAGKISEALKTYIWTGSGSTVKSGSSNQGTSGKGKSDLLKALGG